ncbi:DUF4262 domain-containing protein [Sphingomonas sp. ERG5]|uniref:DUF4262 domain-containing protein n=1 Tax=Sphingomonas sp. ERG5 TaxID=1381597 RepID=UPI000B319BBE|nr:DUF4262 domain-containing protein [Sphingomonas sp. ERG5]
MLDAGEANFVDKVRDYGWFATHVTAEEGHPGFAYTTGFWLTLQVPEVIVFSLKSDIAHDVLWDMFRDAKAGARRPMGTSVPDIFGNTDAYLFPIAKAHYPDHLGWSRWFYGGDDFPCVQLVWPDRAALFPWQPGFDARFSADQPDLSEKGWVSSLSQ